MDVDFSITFLFIRKRILQFLAPSTSHPQQQQPQQPQQNITTEIYQYLAVNYQFEPNGGNVNNTKFKELCDYNSQIAASVSQIQISQSWQILKLLFENVQVPQQKHSSSSSGMNSSHTSSSLSKLASSSAPPSRSNSFLGNPIQQQQQQQQPPNSISSQLSSSTPSSSSPSTVSNTSSSNSTSPNPVTQSSSNKTDSTTSSSATNKTTSSMADKELSQLRNTLKVYHQQQAGTHTNLCILLVH